MYISTTSSESFVIMPSEFLFLNGPFQGYKSEGIMPPPQKMNECSLKRDHIKHLSRGNFHLPTINFSRDTLVFSGDFSMEKQPISKMYLLLKMVLFHCHVRFQGVKKNRVQTHISLAPGSTNLAVPGLFGLLKSREVTSWVGIGTGFGGPI